jgi:hypothetical protein
VCNVEEGMVLTIDQHSPLEMETILASYKAEMKKVKDCGGKGGLSKWRTKIKEEAERLQADQANSKIMAGTCARVLKQEMKDLSERVCLFPLPMAGIAVLT